VEQERLEGEATETETETLPEGCGQVEKRGGRRSNSGRPRRGVFGTLQGDKEYGRNLLSLIMRDHSQRVGLRARCALAILLKGDSRGPGINPALYLGDPPLKPAEVPAADEEVAPESDDGGKKPDEVTGPADAPGNHFLAGLRNGVGPN
jgi:hypothetical protein